MFLIMLTSSYYAGKRYLKYLVQFSTDKCAKNDAPGNYRHERNTAYHQMFKHIRHKFSSKISVYSENQYSHQLVLKYQQHSKKYSHGTRVIYHFCYLSFVVYHFETNFPSCCNNSFPSEVVKCKIDLPLTNPL